MSILWEIWFARNQRLWKNKVITPSIAMSWSLKQVMDWTEANKIRLQKGIKGLDGSVQQRKKWSLPAEGTLKLNVDVSIFSGAEYFLVEMITKDYKG